MSTLLVLLIAWAPQGQDTEEIQQLKRTQAYVQQSIDLLQSDDSARRDFAQWSLETLTGRTDLKGHEAWTAWWKTEGYLRFSAVAPPTDVVVRELQKAVLETELKAQTTKKEVRAVALVGIVAILLFVIMMLFFVGHVSSKIKGWRDLVGRAEIYIKHSQELTQRTDQIAAELDAKKDELAAAMETLRKDQEDEISRRGDEAGTALEHRLRMELQTLRQKAERELDQTVTDLKTQLETTARRLAK